MMLKDEKGIGYIELELHPWIKGACLASAIS
jgi:hypothetical protein